MVLSLCLHFNHTRHSIDVEAEEMSIGNGWSTLLMSVAANSLIPEGAVALVTSCPLSQYQMVSGRRWVSCPRGIQSAGTPVTAVPYFVAFFVGSIVFTEKRTQILGCCIKEQNIFMVLDTLGGISLWYVRGRTTWH